jgi:hypothetical protein
MYVEQTKDFETIGNPAQFAIQDLTIEELELIQSSLVTFKEHSLQDAEVFKVPRKLAVDMFEKIDQELVNARSPKSKS